MKWSDLSEIDVAHFSASIVNLFLNGFLLYLISGGSTTNLALFVIFSVIISVLITSGLILGLMVVKFVNGEIKNIESLLFVANFLIAIVILLFKFSDFIAAIK